MSTGRGSIYQRAGTWTVDFTVNGRRVREGVGQSKRLAEAVLRKRMTEVLEGRYFPAKAEMGRMPFAEFGQMYLERVTSQQKSARTESNRVRYWMKVFGKRPLGSITRSELEAWQRTKRQAVRPATCNRTLGRLRHCLRKAVEWNLLSAESNPMKGLKFLRENNARQRYLSFDECDRLVSSCIAPWVRAIVTIALHTGMRLGEILSLRRQDIDLRTGMIAILDSKNGSGRSIPMDAVVRTVLGQCSTSGASDLMFTNAAGKRFKDIRTAFHNARRRAGLVDFHFHDLRHTFASHWMMSGGDLYTLSKILGHKTIHMTQRYAHFEFQQKVVDRLDNIWNRGGDSRSVTSDPIPEQFPVTPRSQAVDNQVREETRHATDAGSGHVN